VGVNVGVNVGYLLRLLIYAVGVNVGYLLCQVCPRVIGVSRWLAIDRLIGKAAVRFTLPETYRIHPLFHVSVIKPYRRSKHTITLRPPIQTKTGSQYMKLKTCLITNPSRRADVSSEMISWQFLTKWKGYAHEHNSWEPYDNIASKDLTLGPNRRAISGEPQFQRQRPDN